jgi:hypothetical protein
MCITWPAYFTVSLNCYFFTYSTTTATIKQVLAPETLLKKRQVNEKTRAAKAAAAAKKRTVSII